MRFVVSEYMSFTPRRLAARRAGTHAHFAGILSYTQRPAFARITAALLVLALGSGGVAYAAEGTLPGDALYPVKVNVIEPAEGLLLAGSPRAEAAWQLTLAERRVEEAATLASEGRLATSTEAEIGNRFVASVNAASAAQGGASTNQTAVADAVFAAKLSAYAAVFATVDTERHTDATAALRQMITAQAEAAAARANAGAQTPGTADAPEIARLGTHAADALDASAALITHAKTTLAASSTSSAEGAFARSAALAAEGDALLKQGDHAGALRAFQNSLSETARLDVLARAATTLRIDAFASEDATTTSTVPKTLIRNHGADQPIYDSSRAKGDTTGAGVPSATTGLVASGTPPLIPAGTTTPSPGPRATTATTSTDASGEAGISGSVNGTPSTGVGLPKL